MTWKSMLKLASVQSLMWFERILSELLTFETVVQPKFYSEFMVWMDNLKNLQSLYGKIYIFDAL